MEQVALTPHTAGVASAVLPQLVDPEVTRAKFEEEVRRFRAGEASQRQRGVLLVRAECPVVVLAFAAPQVKFTPVVFGARVDFTDYDHSPPSLRLVNPFTEEPYSTVDASPTKLYRRLVAQTAEGTLSVQVQQYLQQHEGHLPFVCMRGVREYHEHPAHTGDAWVLRRREGRGTLSDIVDQLHLFGISGLAGIQIATQVQLRLEPEWDRMPGDPLPMPINVEVAP